MANNDGKKMQSFAGLLSELSDEVDEDRHATMTPADQKLDEVAREILRLARDLTVPGSSSSEAVRLERLMSFIETRDF